MLSHCRHSIYGEYATWQVMEEYLPRDIHRNYKSIFNEFDVDGTGVIRIEDVAKCVSNSSVSFTPEDIRGIMHKVIKCDHCYSNEIMFVDFLEFLSINLSLNTNCVPEDEMLQVFKIFDQDGDGFIGREELRNLLSKLGDEVSEKEVEEMIEEADRDGDGLVSYHEFVRIITNSTDNHQPSSSSSSDQNSESDSVFGSTVQIHEEVNQEANASLPCDEVFTEEQYKGHYTKNLKSSKRKISFRKSFRSLSLRRTKSRNCSSPMQCIEEHDTIPSDDVFKTFSLSRNLKYKRNSCAFEIEQNNNNIRDKIKPLKSNSVTNFASSIFRKSRKLRKSLSSL